MALNKSDGAVAVRSLPRRFREILAGPKGDDAWERIVRTVSDDGRSALGFAVYATGVLVALGTAIAALPIRSRPSIALKALDSAYSEPAPSTAVEEVLAELTAAADRAASAVEGRSSDDMERSCTVDGHHIEAGELLEQAVHACVTALRRAEAAIDAAR